LLAHRNTGTKKCQKQEVFFHDVGYCFRTINIEKVCLRIPIGK
jgi:hypothetical protein